MQGVGFGLSVQRHGGRSLKKIKIEEEKLAEQYPFNCSFYLDPPTEAISLQDFEDYAVARLSFLRIIERHNLSSNAKYSPEWEAHIRGEVKKSKCSLVNKEFLSLLDPNRSAAGTEQAKSAAYDEQLTARRIDHISHYLLRLAFCRTDDLRKWMTSLEVDFFRFKFAIMSNKDREWFLQHYKLEFKKVTPETHDELRYNLSQASFSANPAKGDVDFYEVPFTQVLDLVRSRKVFLKNGTAFIPYHEVGTIIASTFRSKLSQLLAITCKAMSIVEEDERLVRLLTDFEKSHTGSNYVINGSKGTGVTASMLDDLSKKSMPLCMKNLYDMVVEEHHLKHWGRLQLGLFFKAINLSIEEATKFWRSNFTQKAGMDGTRFDKQYLYNIRHMYGQEGKRADYTPYSCMKIISSSVGPGDHHGCPFRHSDATPLRVKLADALIPASGVKEIMELAEAKHYQIACQKYYEFTHNSTIEGGLNHPNQYFEESQAVLRGRVKLSKK